MYLSAEILPDSSNRKTQPGHLHEGAAQLLALYLHIQRLFRLEFTRLKFPTLSPRVRHCHPSGEFWGSGMAFVPLKRGKSSRKEEMCFHVPWMCFQAFLWE